METRKIIVLRGLQGSGKSTWAKQWVNEDPEHRVRFNRDDVRNMLGKYWVPSREKLINDLYREFLASSIKNGYNIIIDNMNLDEKYIKEVEEVIEYFNSLDNQCYVYEIEIKDFFHIPLQVCIDRDAQRENPIGEKVIRNTFNKYKDKIIPWKYLN